MAFLECDAITVAYAGHTVMRDLDLSVAEGEFLSLLGPSGCGKTTLLRVLAGLVSATSGMVRLAGEDITAVPAHRRNFGVVFQNYALFPHLNVWENVAFGLLGGRMARSEARAVAARMLGLVQMSDLAERRIDSLSGGQQQRVAIARALATTPRLLLLDEPFSALDRKLRVELQVELRRLLREVGVTTIFVTHDQGEAFALSDRVAVMRRGTIEQIDIPSALYNRPCSPFVLDFVGTASRFAGIAKTSEHGMIGIETPYGALKAEANFRPGSHVLVAIRPERIAVLDDGAPRTENEIVVSARDQIYLGGQMLLSFEATGSDRLVAIVPEGQTGGFEVGGKLRLVLPAEHLIVLPSPV